MNRRGIAAACMPSAPEPSQAAAVGLIQINASSQAAAPMKKRTAKAWYVSFIVRGGTHGAHRTTRTFANESDAKTFAVAKSAAGDATLMAGTINPIYPKRVISSAEIPDWLSGDQQE